MKYTHMFESDSYGVIVKGCWLWHNTFWRSKLGMQKTKNLNISKSIWNIVFKYFFIWFFFCYKRVIEINKMKYFYTTILKKQLHLFFFYNKNLAKLWVILSNEFVFLAVIVFLHFFLCDKLVIFNYNIQCVYYFNINGIVLDRINHQYCNDW